MLSDACSEKTIPDGAVLIKVAPAGSMGEEAGLCLDSQEAAVVCQSSPVTDDRGPSHKSLGGGGPAPRPGAEPLTGKRMHSGDVSRRCRKRVPACVPDVHADACGSAARSLLGKQKKKKQTPDATEKYVRCARGRRLRIPDTRNPALMRPPSRPGDCVWF